ncbi:MAG: glycosyltransferase family 1 protein [Candidatus Daviesbacteria bacterium]|nr:glycosyltransferase family 1 protein [Candidatus Daviesbacteria bacterium]
MKIWIDGYEANVLQRLGSSQVAFELLKSLEKIDSRNDYVILLPAPPLGDLPKERAGWRYKILRPRKLWTRIALPLALYSTSQKPDIFFSPTHYIPRFTPIGIKRVVIIFDLSFLRFPEMFESRDLWQLKNWSKFSVDNAQHIITISNASKKDIIGQYGVNKDSITVAYPGIDKDIFHPIKNKMTIQKTLKKYEIKYPYIIFIGTLQPRKNLQRLMEAFSRVIHLEGENVRWNKAHLRGELSTDDLKLIIVGKTTGKGKQGWMYKDILQTPKNLGIEGKVKFLGFVPTEDLAILLSEALAFVQPSLWEGFGIPVVEAMATGTPVIVSNISSLPEVAGKAGFLVDPYSVDQIEQAIRTVVTDKKLSQKYSKAGIAQAKKFSWDKMAITVLRVFEKVVSS